MDIIPGEVNGYWRIALVIGIAVCVHIIVRLIRKLHTYVSTVKLHHSLSKTKTMAGLVASVSIFAVYFVAVGIVLSEFGISLTAYFASASIIGVAVAFGSQGMVQDIVSGLTIIITDLYEIDDMVEIGGQAGIVKSITMRFTVIENAMGAEVFIPNRSVNNVINFPRGYVRCIADITLSEDSKLAEQQKQLIASTLDSIYEQYPGIFRRPPGIEGIQTTTTGRTYLRAKFRIWPGRGGPIETHYKQEVLQIMKSIDPNYADWMISINYEVEHKK